jgi:thiamine pyrophosphokinase
MLLEVMQWAHAQGAAYMHFGGGLGGREDSLFHFKAGFSKQRADFFTYRLIADSQAYDTLCIRWQEQHQAPLDETFFPAYRK